MMDETYLYSASNKPLSLLGHLKSFTSSWFRAKAPPINSSGLQKQEWCPQTPDSPQPTPDPAHGTCKLQRKGRNERGKTSSVNEVQCLLRSLSGQITSHSSVHSVQKTELRPPDLTSSYNLAQRMLSASQAAIFTSLTVPSKVSCSKWLEVKPITVRQLQKNTKVTDFRIGNNKNNIMNKSWVLPHYSIFSFENNTPPQ